MRMSEIPDAVVASARHIKLLILDVDGVLSDGKLYFDAEGNEYKSFHARDGHGIKLLQQSGVKVAVISGRNSAMVARRLKSLGIELIYQGYEDKRGAFAEIIALLGLNTAQIAYVGDDILDLPIMVKVGLSVVVQDGHFFVKQHAHWQTPTKGGEGAVRDVCDLLMQAQGTFAALTQAYLR